MGLIPPDRLLWCSACTVGACCLGVVGTECRVGGTDVM